MSKKYAERASKKVVVTGDIVVQKLELTRPPVKSIFTSQNQFYNWESFPTGYFTKLTL